MSLSAPETSSLTDLRARGHTSGALNVHPYFGRVDPALAQTLIEDYSSAGACVLDPFCGSGTVLHEALLLGRTASGWDSSPLAVGISLAKMSCPNDDETSAVLKFGESLAPWSTDAGLFRKAIAGEPDIPPMPRLQSVMSWFGDSVLRELGFIRECLLATDSTFSPIARLLAWLAFSRIVTKASNQQGESSYRRVDKQHADGEVVALYRRAVADVCSTTATLQTILGDRTGTELCPTGGRYAWGSRCLEVAVHDSRTPSGETPLADLVVTSPPYLMSWDYGLYHKLRFYWLGLDLDSYEETEIGRHLRRRNDDIERYRDDMVRVFRTLRGSVTEDATIAMINAPSVVYGELVDTNSVLAECGAMAGWDLVTCTPSLALTGPHHGMYASLVSRNAVAPGASGKQEHVLVFRRTGC